MACFTSVYSGKAMVILTVESFHRNSDFHCNENSKSFGDNTLNSHDLRG